MKKLTKTSKKIRRPTKYKPDVINPQIDEYLAGCGLENQRLPSIDGLALHLKVNPDTIYEWSKKYPEFSENIKKIATRQREDLVNTMFAGREINGSMAIFLLKSVHGYREQPTNQTNIQINVKPILGDMSAE